MDTMRVRACDHPDYFQPENNKYEPEKQYFGAIYIDASNFVRTECFSTLQEDDSLVVEDLSDLEKDPNFEKMLLPQKK